MERERVQQRERSADILLQQRLELEKEEKARSEDGWRAAIDRLTAKQQREVKSMEHSMHQLGEEIRASQAHGLMEIVNATTVSSREAFVVRPHDSLIRDV